MIQKGIFYLNVFKPIIFVFCFWGEMWPGDLFLFAVLSFPEYDHAVSHTIVDSANHSMRQGVLPL